MPLRKVILKARLGRGEFYWVTQIDAASEEEAITAAEHLFLAELDKNQDWQFDEFDVE